MSALAFTVLALALVGPVPALLARASWTMRAPRASVVLWQAIALAAVLSAFSEDRAVLNEVQRGMDTCQDPHISIATDAGPLRYRHRLAQLIAAEILESDATSA